MCANIIQNGEKAKEVPSQENKNISRPEELLPEPLHDEDSDGKSMNNMPIFLDAVFYKGRSHVLYSESGAGKSLLSIEIGKSDVFKKPLYILVDSDGGEDLPRYTKTLDDKAIIIGLKNFQKKADRLEQERKNGALCQIFVLGNVAKERYEWYSKLESIMARVQKRMGIKNGDCKPIDNFLVLEKIITKEIQTSGVDFICIDSLNAVAGDPRGFSREKIRHITRKAADSHVTLLCLHHTNKRGDISGPSAISEEVDYVYRLSRDTSAGENDDVLILEEEKARYSKPKTIRIKRTFDSGLTPEYTLLGQTGYTPHEAGMNKEPNLDEKIRRIILQRSGDTISFNELKTQLPSSAPGAIKNSLKNSRTTMSLKKPMAGGPL
jgi:hypothetical protein